MTDKSQESVSDNVVKEEVKEQAQVFETAPETSSDAPVVEEKKEEKRVPLHELYKERNKRRALEDEIAKLRAEHETSQQTINKVRQTQEDDELVAEAEKELGIDKDAARKLLKLQRKVAESVNPKQSPNKSTLNDPTLKAIDDFKKRASEASVEYDDWNDMIPSMTAIIAKEIEANGVGAYAKSPEYYYSKALKAQRDADSRSRKEADVDKNNNASVAMVESGSGGSRNSKAGKITQAVFDANRSDVKWVRENETEIKALWKEGKLT